jgi:hypothetical protein
MLPGVQGDKMKTAGRIDANQTHIAGFFIHGAPRTKKTSQRIVRIGKHAKILPSKAHEEWFAIAMSQGATIRRQLKAAGVLLPITGQVAVKATFYRDALRGDATGYYQALADALQMPHGKRGGLGIVVDDKQIAHWDGSRLDKDKGNPRIEVEITALAAGK